jgi:hypothetical protein
VLLAEKKQRGPFEISLGNLEFSQSHEREVSGEIVNLNIDNSSKRTI